MAALPLLHLSFLCIYELRKIVHKTGQIDPNIGMLFIFIIYISSINSSYLKC